MFVVNCLNLNNGVKFDKSFWSRKEFKEYIRKVKYSKKVKILGFLDYSHLYD